MEKAISSLIFSTRQVFSKISYVVLSIVVFLAVLVLAIWLPNVSFLAHTAMSDIFTLSQKVGIISSSLEAIQTNFSPLSRVVTVLIALLFSINTSFFIFLVLRISQLNKEAGVGTSGFLLGLFGIGCASCGSVLLSSIFGIGATAGFIGLFPLKGQEFGLLSILVLGISIFLLAKKIKDPLVCRTKPTSVRKLLKRIPLWSKVLSLIILAFLVGAIFANWSINKGSLAKGALAAKFDQLSQNGNSSCSSAFQDSISQMPDSARLQGSCCSPMSFHRYSEQVEGLKKYKDIKEIPPDPYDIQAGLAKQLKAHYDDKLTPDQQKEYDYAMQNSMEKGPCCCKCWRWYVYGGLGKLLIQKYHFTGRQVTEVWNFSDGCGGEEDHVNH